MKKIHKPILDFMSHYARKFEDDVVLSVLDKLAIENEEEAIKVLSFLNTMCDHVATDANNNMVVLNQTVCTADAEKVCDAIEDYIEEIGYEHLVE
jgi:hypothetical protein